MLGNQGCDVVGVCHTLEAQETGTGLDTICCLGYVDYNVPFARQEKSSEALTNGISTVNDSGNPCNNASIMVLPDLPRDSSLRGLYDEEKGILEGCFGVKQHVETRWIDLYTREKRGECRSNMRRFGQGRVVVNGESLANNIWLASELAVCGRPVNANEGERGAPTSVLPRAQALLLPEASSPNSDLRLAERVRPSPEQTSAQKGAQRLELLLESMIRNTSLPGPILLVNLTGYVEELAAAVPDLHLISFDFFERFYFQFPWRPVADMLNVSFSRVNVEYRQPLSTCNPFSLNYLLNIRCST